MDNGKKILLIAGIIMEVSAIILLAKSAATMGFVFLVFGLLFIILGVSKKSTTKP